MVTLHAYILRELLKALGLTAVALTALFTLAGGLSTVMRFEGITAGDLFSVLPMLIPIVVTLTLPIAALFAATITYGRLASDNELVASRAAGINVHRLFLSVVLLSVFVALFTTVSVNVVIPRFMKQLEYLARSNVRDLAFNRLLRRGYIHYGQAGKEQYLLTAQQVQSVRKDQLIAKGFDPPGNGVSYFWVEHPTFLMIDGQAHLKRFAVAEGGLCQFDRSGTGVDVTIYVKDARDYEIGRGVGQVKMQKIGPYPAPIRFPVRPSMVDLKTLTRWRAAPWKVPELVSKISAFRGQLCAYLLYTDAADRLNKGKTLVLHDESAARYEITVRSCVVGHGDVVLEDAKVARYEPQIERPTRYVAARAKLLARPSSTNELIVALELDQTPDRPVLEYNPRSVNYDTPREKESLRLDGLLLPQRVIDEMEQYPAAKVVDPAVALPGGARFEKDRAELCQTADRLRRKVGALIHFRLGFASSALVTILMGAALGVIFRGSRALAAFGLACIPFGIVTVLMLMGRQLAESSSGETIGPYVIWGGLALVAAADVVILRVGVRR